MSEKSAMLPCAGPLGRGALAKREERAFSLPSSNRKRFLSEPKARREIIVDFKANHTLAPNKFSCIF